MQNVPTVCDSRNSHQWGNSMSKSTWQAKGRWQGEVMWAAITMESMLGQLDAFAVFLLFLLAATCFQLAFNL